MALQVWKPDTCGCEIFVEKSDFSMIAFRYKCSVHAALSDSDAWTAIFGTAGENRRKNNLVARIGSTVSAVASVDQPTASTWLITFADGKTITMSMSGTGTSRVWNANTVGFTAQQRSTAQSWCDTTFGAGRIVIT